MVKFARIDVQNAELHETVDATIANPERFEVTATLLQNRKERINSVNTDGDTPLHVAIECTQDYTDIIIRITPANITNPPIPNQREIHRHQ